MSTYLFKLGVFAMLLLFGAIAVFLGLVTGYAAVSSGELTYTHTLDGRRVSTTVARLTNPDAFWRNLALWSALPVVAGFLAAVVGRRGLNRL